MKKDVTLRFSKIRTAENLQLYFVLRSDVKEIDDLWVKLPNHYPDWKFDELALISNKITEGVKKIFSHFNDQNKDSVSFMVEFSDKFIVFGEFPVLTAKNWSDLNFPLSRQEIEFFFTCLSDTKY